MLSEKTGKHPAGLRVETDMAVWPARISGSRRTYRILVGLLVVLDAAVAVYAVLGGHLMYLGWPQALRQTARPVWALPGQILLIARTGEFAPYLPLVTIAPLVVVVVMALMHAYRIKLADLRPFGAAVAVARGSVLSTLLLAVLMYSLGAWPPTAYIYLLYVFLLLFSGVVLVHAGALIVVLLLQAVGIGRVRVATVTSGDVAAHLAETLSFPASAYDYVGNIAPNAEAERAEVGTPVLGPLRDLTQAINNFDLNQIILSADPQGLTMNERLQVAQTCSMMGVELKVIAPFHPFFRTDGQPDFVGDLALLHLERAGLYATVPQLLKRFMDIAVSLAVLLAALPVMVATAILVRLDSPGPIFFRQQRIGLNGRAFTMLKFRSMRADSDAAQHKEYLKQLIREGAAHAVDEDGNPVYKITDDPRITRVGQFIRATSIDELPQLFNVLRGEMSLVGPRPPIQYEVDEYEDWHMKRLNIRPGITGLWQVSGRSSLSFQQMVQLDITYVEQWSLWLDIKILFRTIPVLLKIGQAY